jgi:hypothetical protein
MSAFRWHSPEPSEAEGGGERRKRGGKKEERGGGGEECKVKGLTLHTQRWRHGRTVVSRGADMQITHLRAKMRVEVQRQQLAGVRMQQRKYALRGLEHIAAVNFFEFKRLATRCRAIGGHVL